MSNPGVAIQAWLLDQGRLFADVPSLLEALMPQLRLEVPVDRLWVGTKVLHPQAAAYAWLWEDGAPIRTVEFSHDRFARVVDVDSPLRRLRLSGISIRFRADDVEPTELAEIQALWASGYTDYYAEPLTFRGVWVGGFTFTTRRAGGFADEHIAELARIRPAFAAVIEPLARDSMFSTLLRAYLGDDAGRRVAAGQVRRGDGQELRAAVWFSDVRGFTQLSQQLPRPALLELLNDVFQCVVDTVHAHGGQVLKFMGDGVLAVFAEGDGMDDRAACEAATRAAAAFQVRLAELHRMRVAAGAPVANVGIGLHYGELTYGNIGSPSRLDFTVIGPAVNLAARIEGLCGATGEGVLASEAVAERASGWVSAGTHAAKGIDAPIHTFRPASVG